MTVSLGLELFGAGVVVVAFIVWLVRLEGRVNAGDQRCEDLDDKQKLLAQAVNATDRAHNALSMKVVEELGRIREALARIEGQIRSDA